MVFKAWLQGRRSAMARAGKRDTLGPEGKIHVRIPLTILIGAVGGLLVGLTSVGSGSIIIVCLMLTYPQLRGAHLVGTDLVQAVPLVTSAALAHIIVGDFELGLTTSILIGALPAVYVGARLSSKAPDGIIRPALVFVLLASALKLLDVPTDTLGVILLLVVLVGLPIWGAVDGAAHPQHLWDAAGLRRRTWIRWQAFGAPFLVGFPVSAVYFATARPKLVAATMLMSGEARPASPAAGRAIREAGVEDVRADPDRRRRVAQEREDHPHRARHGRAVRLGRHRRARARVRAIRGLRRRSGSPDPGGGTRRPGPRRGSGTRASRRTARSAA